MNDRLVRVLLTSLLVLTWLFIAFAVLGLSERIAERL